MKSSHLDIDIEKIGQDIKNIRHFLDHLEALLNEAITKGVLKDNERNNTSNSSNS